MAAIILAPFDLPRLRREWPIVLDNLRLICICGFLAVTLFNFLLYTAVHNTTAINAALVYSATPVFIIMFTRIF